MARGRPRWGPQPASFTGQLLTRPSRVADTIRDLLVRIRARSAVAAAAVTEGILPACHHPATSVTVGLLAKTIRWRGFGRRHQTPAPSLCRTSLRLFRR